MSELIKNDKKTINAWCMYDWANSVYALTITTAVFPSYWYGVTGGKNAIIDQFGLSNTVVYESSLSIAFLLVAIMNPFLSSIADFGGHKKKFMQFFCYLGSLSCIGLYFFDGPETVLIGIGFFILAAIGFAGSLVFYNSYLPIIATEDNFDKYSAKGFALGYIGSVLLLILNLAMIQMPELFGIPVNVDGKAIDGTFGPRFSFLLVGIWWMGFAQITFRRLPSNPFKRKVSGELLKKGLSELVKVWQQAQHLPMLKKFLISFFFYSMGVQTIMYLATIFGEDEVGLKIDELIILVLILQILAIFGAWTFSKISKSKGNIFSLQITLVIWIGVCIAAYFVGEGMKLQYYIIGVFVGFVMGGVQSMSRSTYSKFIPQETDDHASFFSFYETLEKVSIALGTMVFALVDHFTGSMQLSALVLGVFFVVGIIILSKIPSKTIYNTHVNSDEN